MKEWGYIIVFAGVCYLFYAFNMDVSYNGAGVVNLDLIARRQNHLIVACLATFLGAMMAIFGGRSSAENVSAPTASPKRADIFEGERLLSNDAYRLWLADAYSIERNEVFEKFVMGDTTFETLEEALRCADDIDTKKTQIAMEADKQRELEDAQRQEEWSSAREEADAKWEAEKPKFYAVLLIVILIMVGVGIFG
jgi:hypothetical protein